MRSQLQLHLGLADPTTSDDAFFFVIVLLPRLSLFAFSTIFAFHRLKANPVSLSSSASLGPQKGLVIPFHRFPARDGIAPMDFYAPTAALGSA
jgi:hypothetical protein